MDDKELIKAWADFIGVDPDSEPALYGWPRDFSYFKAGWDAAMAASSKRLKLFNERCAFLLDEHA